MTDKKEVLINGVTLEVWAAMSEAERIRQRLLFWSTQYPFYAYDIVIKPSTPTSN